jgi:hypothetical protein
LLDINLFYDDYIHYQLLLKSHLRYLCLQVIKPFLKGTCMMHSFLSLVVLGTLGLAALPALAVDSPLQTVEIMRSNAEIPLTVKLDPSTVRCLVGDYGASSLKISMENLKGYTVFRHTTRGEVQPCINAGACKTRFNPDGFSPEMILNPARPTEEIKVRIVLHEVLRLDHANKTCDRSLVENVVSQVRGLKFAHQDSAELGKLEYKACLAMIGK